MKGTVLKSLLKQFEPTHAIIAASLYLGLNRNNHSLSLGLLIAWIGIRCGQQIWKSRNDQDWRLKGLFPIIIFGITIFQSRTIIQLDDHPGGSLYILIAASLYAGSCFAIPQKKLLLRWISGAALAINTKILFEGISANYNILNSGWIAQINNDVFEIGFGRINSLASVIAYFTIISFYGARTDSSPFARLLHGLTLTTGYFLCLQSQSEMAIGAPFIAAIFTFLLCRKDYFKNIRSSRLNYLTITLSTAVGSIIAWALALKSEKIEVRQDGLHIGLGEQWRIEQWTCWLDNSILKGNNKIIHGIGYNTDQIFELCNNNNPDGGLVQFISQHGLLGVFALLILLVFLFKNIAYLRNSECSSIPTSNLFRCQWSETAIGAIIAVLLCNFITPSYSGSYLSASIIGIILSLGIDLNLSQEMKT